MSELTPPELWPPSRHPERFAGIFIAITWAAFTFAGFGILAVILDRDPIEIPVSPYVGLGSIGVAMLAVYLGVIATVPRKAPWTGSVLTALAVYGVWVLGGAIADLNLGIAQATSPFVVVAGLLAFATPLTSWYYFAALRRRS